MRFTVSHIVILLVAAVTGVIECGPTFLQPHIVLDKPYTVFDTGPATVQVKARTGVIKFRCVKHKQETIAETDFGAYQWRRTEQAEIIASNEYYSLPIMKTEEVRYVYTCRIGTSTKGGLIIGSPYSYPVTIIVIEGGPPLGSHPEVSDYTSTSVDVSWKKPDTTDTFTDYDIKISPIYSKETASAVKGDVENPNTHLTNLKPWTSYEVTVRTHTLLDGDDYYGPEKKQSFMTKDAANQKERSLVSIVTCFILSLCVSF